MSFDLDIYRTHSAWTDPGAYAERLREIPPEPEGIVAAISGFLLHPMIAPMRGIEVPEAARDDRTMRSVQGLLGRALARDGRALDEPREPAKRVFCVCAGFARLATAVFRTHGHPARCRAGFSAYFNPGFLEDHWVCEFWGGDEWRFLDAQLDEAARAAISQAGIELCPWDVSREQFLDASTAWCRLRAGGIDPSRIGLSPLNLSGEWFVAGAVMLDAAALNKEEMLPWEKWSVGRDLALGAAVPPAEAARFDQVAALLAGAPDAARAAAVYRENAWLRVTPSVLSFADGAPAEVAVVPSDVA